ncbi:hypothetical protein TWF481_004371 [Arthrobotrys musiformis]|uniref:ZZ-type domain-containing protein n=1 Tax=Arthrobotrys musiformis TaxID=47236 RepID=A0AAV9WQ42_9PEZI
MSYQVDYNTYNTYRSEYGPIARDAAQQSNQTGFYDENSEYICDICKSHNFSGTVYHCKTCMNGDFDMCESCRTQGRNCFCGHGGNIIPLRIIPGKGRKCGAIAGLGANIDLEDLAATTLSDLLPINTKLNDPLENPELLPYYERFAAYTDTHRNPPYNTFLCSSAREYEAWENEAYNPQKSYYERKIADFGEILVEARHFAQYTARSGSKGWEYQTPDGELVDTLDFLIHLTIKLEETYKDLSDLDVEIAAKKAQALEKYSCDIIIAKVTAEVDAIKSNGQFQSKHEERTKAADTLKHHYDIRKKLEDRLLNFRRAQVNAYLTYRISESPEHEIAAKSECEISLNGATRMRDETIRSISEEYDARVAKSLLPAISSVSAMVPALPQYNYSASMSQTSYSTQPPPPLPPRDTNTNTVAQTSSNSVPTSTASANPPKYQMPLSYYSNLLTQQHVPSILLDDYEYD